MCSRPVSKYQKKFCFVCTHACIYIAYEVRISCKGPLSAALYVFSYLKNQFYVFQTAPMVVNRLTSVLSTSSPVSLTGLVFMYTFNHLKKDSKSRQKHL